MSSVYERLTALISKIRRYVTYKARVVLTNTSRIKSKKNIEVVLFFWNVIQSLRWVPLPQMVQSLETLTQKWSACSSRNLQTHTLKTWFNFNLAYQYLRCNYLRYCKRLYFCQRLSVCLSVCRITQKLQLWFWPKLVEGLWL